MDLSPLEMAILQMLCQSPTSQLRALLSLEIRTLSLNAISILIMYRLDFLMPWLRRADALILEPNQVD